MVVSLGVERRICHMLTRFFDTYYRPENGGIARSQILPELHALLVIALSNPLEDDLE